jgi:hypothetical protein
MTCGRISDLFDRFLEMVKRALEERVDAEYCIYERDIRGYIVPRPRADRAYACGAYATLHRSRRILVVPGAVIVYNVDLDNTQCKAIKDYDVAVRYLEKRPYYTVCIYDQPVEFSRALICAY